MSPAANARKPQRDINQPDHERAYLGVSRLSFEDPRVYELAYFCIRKGETRASARTYGYEAARALGWFAERSIDPLSASRDEVSRWWASTAGFSPSTRGHALGFMRAFYRAAIKRGYCLADPLDDTEAPKRDNRSDTPALTLDEFKRLVWSIRGEYDHPERGLAARRDMAIVALMTRLCMRCNEVHGLWWSDFTTERGRPLADFIGKQHVRGKLFLPEDVLASLQDWRTSFTVQTGVDLHPYDPVFVGLSAARIRQAQARKPGTALRPLSNAALYDIVVGRLRDVGLDGPRYAPHCLRATGATLALEGGADLVECQALLRHANADTTRKFYLKRVDELAQPGMDAMQIRVDFGR